MVHCGWYQGCPYRAWTDGVDTNTFAELLVGETASEGDDSALCGGVVEEVWTADIGVYGSVIDDTVAAVEVGKSVFGEVEIRVDVGVEGTEPLISVRKYICQRRRG